MYYGKFREVSPASVKAGGHLHAFLKKQNEGISSNFKAQGYPFDTPMWDGGVKKRILASVICHDEVSETPMQESWWPYEQSAYLLDGLLRLGILLDDKEKIGLFEKNLKWVIEHPDADGLLGHCYNDSTSEWPMAVFFRAVSAYCAMTGDEKVREAFIRHYSAISADKLCNEFRNINNLEGLLKVYEWTGQKELLDKALEAYCLHNKRNAPPVENEFELYWDRLTSGRNFVIHGVSFCESLKLPVLLAMYSGDKSYLEGAEKALREVLSRHEQIPGLPSSNEDFAGCDPLQGYETCDTVDFTWTLGYFLMATGKAEYADRIEKIIYNALPGSLTKDFCTLQYMSAPNQTIAADYSNHLFFFRGQATFRQFRADHSAQCCPGNVHRAMPDFLMRMWMQNEDNTPAAVMYGPSVFSGGGYSIEEITNYPYEETVLFRFHTGKPLEMPFTFRIPGWCESAVLTRNGESCDFTVNDNGFAAVNGIWHDGDELLLTLPMKPVQKSDRNWSWFELGPLVFAMPVAHEETREYESAFAPRNFEPAAMWNFGVAPASEAKVIRGTMNGTLLDSQALKLRIPAFPVTGFDALEQGRYTPEIPLYCQASGETVEIELVPYGSTILRITAFPDAVKRRVLPVYQVLTTRTYPYDGTKPLSEQVFQPEIMSEKELIASAQEMQMDHSGFYDLIHHFGPQTDSLAYMLFRVWADRAGEACFAVGASDGAECFVNGRKVYTIEPPADGEFMAPYWFRAEVRKGYNVLMLKVCEGPTLLQYRKAWGAKVTGFYEK